MKKANATVTIVTPCLLAGTDQSTAELRPASLRGQLRWWFRLLNPGQKQREKAIFGGIQRDTQASSIVVRIKTRQDQINVVKNKKADDISGSSFDYFLWPLGRKNSQPRGYIAPGQSFDLSVSHRYVRGAENLPEDVFRAFLLFGSLGTRSRRTYGSIYPETGDIDDQEWSPPQNLEEFAETAENLLKAADCDVLQIGEVKDKYQEAIKTSADFLKKFRCGSEKSGRPSKWGKNDHDAPFEQNPDVYRQALGLPLEQRYSQPQKITFRSENKDRDVERWASPLLLKIVPLGDKYLPLAIFCNSMLMPENSEIVLQNKQDSVHKKLSHDLWDAMRNPDRHGEVGWKGAKTLV